MLLEKFVFHRMGPIYEIRKFATWRELSEAATHQVSAVRIIDLVEKAY